MDVRYQRQTLPALWLRGIDLVKSGMEAHFTTIKSPGTSLW